MHKSVLPNSRTLFSSGGIEIRLYDATRILLKSVRRWNCGVGNITILEKIYASYTISSGIFPKYLNGENIISVPLAENETMHIGYVLNENQELSELGKSFLEELRKYAPANP